MRPTTKPARSCTEKSSNCSPSSLPTSACGTETNIAIAQPAIEGIRLSPQGDFSFLRNVSR